VIFNGNFRVFQFNIYLFNFYLPLTSFNLLNPHQSAYRTVNTIPLKQLSYIHDNLIIAIGSQKIPVFVFLTSLQLLIPLTTIF